MNHYIAIAGSNRQGSKNKKLIRFVQERYAKMASIETVDIGGLPVFYKTPDRTIPERVQEMGAKIAEADGVIISTPEYDHGVPAVLMNALEWLSYTIHPFRDKPVLIMGASYGRLGASRAQQMLRKMLDAPELAARLMPSSEYMIGNSLQSFNDNGELTEEEQTEILDNLFADFETFVSFNKGFDHHRDEALEKIKRLEEEQG